jgi:hypothetical protein
MERVTHPFHLRSCAPAQRSSAALRRVSSHCLDDDTPTHGFKTLLDSLATINRNNLPQLQAFGSRLERLQRIQQVKAIIFPAGWHPMMLLSCAHVHTDRV